MGFIPDPYSATVRIGARWRAGKLTALNDQPLPSIRDGAFMELVIPAWAILNEEDLGDCSQSGLLKCCLLR